MAQLNKRIAKLIEKSNENIQEGASNTNVNFQFNNAQNMNNQNINDENKNQDVAIYDETILNAEEDEYDILNDPIKRFKMSDSEEAEINSQGSIINQELPVLMELDDTNSVKLKKGNLVIRKYINKESEDYESSQLCTVEGYKVVYPKSSKAKSVRYMADEALEKVKFFQKDAEPNAPALTL